MNSKPKEYKGKFTNPGRRSNKKYLSVSLKDMIPDYSELFEKKRQQRASGKAVRWIIGLYQIRRNLSRVIRMTPINAGRDLLS